MLKSISKSKYDWSDLENLYIDQQLSAMAIAKMKGCTSCSIVYEALKRIQLPRRTRPEAAKIAMMSGRGYRPTKADMVKRSKPIGYEMRHGASGYILVKMPDHPRANRGYVFKQILVWEEVHQRPVPKGWEVHHLNGIKDDNTPRNLEALPSREHKVMLAAKAKRIRELEAQVKLLEHTLEQNQLMFKFGDN